MENVIKTRSFRILKKLFPAFNKLCIITTCFPPCPRNVKLLLGGIFVKYVQLAEELQYCKQPFFAISLYYQNFSKAQNAPNVYRVGTYKPYAISRVKMLYPLLEFFNPFIFIKCVHIFKSEKPDVVLIGDMLQMSVSPIIAAKILGIRVVIEHDWICPIFPRNIACNLTHRISNCGRCLEEQIGKKQNKIVKYTFGIFSAFMYLIKKNIWNRCIVFAESEYFHKLYIKWGIKPDLIYRVPPSPTVDKFTRSDSVFEEKLRKQVGSSKVLVYAGRLSTEKGIKLLFQSYKILKRKMKKSIKLVIAGDGLLKDFVVKESLNDTDVLYLGWLERDKLRCIYPLADIVVVPSIHPEAYPHVALEALAFNKKTVGFKMGGLVEISKGDSNMILVESLSPEAYADKIMENIK